MRWHRSSLTLAALAACGRVGLEAAPDAMPAPTTVGPAWEITAGSGSDAATCGISAVFAPG